VAQTPQCFLEIVLGSVMGLLLSINLTYLLFHRL